MKGYNMLDLFELSDSGENDKGYSIMCSECIKMDKEDKISKKLDKISKSSHIENKKSKNRCLNDDWSSFSTYSYKEDFNETNYSAEIPTKSKKNIRSITETKDEKIFYKESMTELEHDPFQKDLLDCSKMNYQKDDKNESEKDNLKIYKRKSSGEQLKNQNNENISSSHSKNTFNQKSNQKSTLSQKSLCQDSNESENIENKYLDQDPFMDIGMKNSFCFLLDELKTRVTNISEQKSNPEDKNFVSTPIDPEISSQNEYNSNSPLTGSEELIEPINFAKNDNVSTFEFKTNNNKYENSIGHIKKVNNDKVYEYSSDKIYNMQNNTEEKLKTQIIEDMNTKIDILDNNKSIVTSLNDTNKIIEISNTEFLLNSKTTDTGNINSENIQNIQSFETKDFDQVMDDLEKKNYSFNELRKKFSVPDFKDPLEVKKEMKIKIKPKLKRKKLQKESLVSIFSNKISQVFSGIKTTFLTKKKKSKKKIVKKKNQEKLVNKECEEKKPLLTIPPNLNDSFLNLNESQFKNGLRLFEIITHIDDEQEKAKILEEQGILFENHKYVDRIKQKYENNKDIFENKIGHSICEKDKINLKENNMNHHFGNTLSNKDSRSRNSFKIQKLKRIFDNSTVQFSKKSVKGIIQNIFEKNNISDFDIDSKKNIHKKPGDREKFISRLSIFENINNNQNFSHSNKKKAIQNDDNKNKNIILKDIVCENKSNTVNKMILPMNDQKKVSEQINVDHKLVLDKQQEQINVNQNKNILDSNQCQISMQDNIKNGKKDSITILSSNSIQSHSKKHKETDFYKQSSNATENLLQSINIEFQNNPQNIDTDTFSNTTQKEFEKLNIFEQENINRNLNDQTKNKIQIDLEIKKDNVLIQATKIRHFYTKEELEAFKGIVIRMVEYFENLITKNTINAR